MQYRVLGRNGPLVSALGLGCMGMSGSYGAADQTLSIAAIQTAYYEFGVTFFDTADMYGNGDNEKLLGEIVKPFRDEIVIATKCGIQLNDPAFNINSSPEYIKQACMMSLSRLELDYIDVYYLHRNNPLTPIEDSMQAMLELIEEGKINYVGLSEASANTIERAHAILGDKLIAVQTEYSIVNREAAELVLPVCKKLGIGFVPYSPIARGFLTGKIRNSDSFINTTEYDFRSSLPQFQPENFQSNLKLITAMENIARQKQCTLAQLSLAWLLAQGENIVPIPGTKRREYLGENTAAVDIILSKADLEQLSNIRDENPVIGKRLPDELMKTFNLTI